ETIAALSEHQNIFGIKDSSGDVRALIHTLSLVKDDFAVITGSAPTLYPSLTVGARGAILAVANFAPKLCIEIHRLANSSESQKRNEARAAQARLFAVSKKIKSRYGIGGIKHAMGCVGYKGGFVRKPLTMPDAPAERNILTCLEENRLK